MAYTDGALGWASRPGVALPFRFRGPRPKAVVSANGKTVTCQIVDVGPSNTNDPYWMTGTRPQAEVRRTCRGSGRAARASISAAAAIGLDGKGEVVWFFDLTGAGPMPDTTTTIPQLNLLNLPQLQAIQKQIET